MITENLKNLNIPSNEPIVVAVSGGPDSMALLSLLESHFDTIICAHVNHNTGRNGQDEDEDFVKEYCEKHGFIFETMKIENYEKENFHAQTHKKRYDFFEIILQKYNSHYLFTAHHGDDLMETMLFRMMRGATVNAIHGFSYVSKMKDYQMIRPLLMATKKELLDYVETNHIPYRVDPSNEKDVYTRNRIRKYILPYIKKEQPNAHLKFLKLSQELEEMEAFIGKTVNEELEKRFSNDCLSISNWSSVDAIIQKRILQTILATLYKNHQEVLTDKHITQLQKLILNSTSGAMLDFPGQFKIRKEYEMLRFFKSEATGYNYVFKTSITLPNNDQIKMVEKEESDSNFVCRLSKEDIVFPLHVRTRKPQDKMQVKGLNGSKKIKDIFVNSKVPVHKRGDYPIVVDNENRIVWLPGLKKSQFDKTKEEKYDIILRYIKEGKD